VSSAAAATRVSSSVSAFGHEKSVMPMLNRMIASFRLA
jgi:hypothetical protein